MPSEKGILEKAGSKLMVDVGLWSGSDDRLPINLCSISTSSYYLLLGLANRPLVPVLTISLSLIEPRLEPESPLEDNLPTFYAVNFF